MNIKMQCLLSLFLILTMISCNDTVHQPVTDIHLSNETKEMVTEVQTKTPPTVTLTNIPSNEDNQTVTVVEPYNEMEEVITEIQTKTPAPGTANNAPIRGSKSMPANGGRPEDKYSCVISPNGYCIFTGKPHETGLNPSTEDIVDGSGKYLFPVDKSIAVNSSGKVLVAKGTPASDGDELTKYSQQGMTEDEKSFHKVMAIMFPIRNALMYDIADIDRDRWNLLTKELRVRSIKDTTFTDGPTPRDNYYGIQGVFDLAKNPGGRDIHHDVMKFLEESGIYLLCHTTSDEFNKMLRDTHPENHNPCQDGRIVLKIPF